MYVARRLGVTHLARQRAHAAALDLAASERTALSRGWRYVGDPGEPAFGPGYANTVERVAFYLDTQGFVLLAGRATSSGTTTPMFVLPTGYRPARRLEFSARSDGNSYVIAEVFPDGVVASGTPFYAGLRLDGIMFRLN